MRQRLNTTSVGGQRTWILGTAVPSTDSENLGEMSKHEHVGRWSIRVRSERFLAVRSQTKGEFGRRCVSSERIYLGGEMIYGRGKGSGRIGRRVVGGERWRFISDISDITCAERLKLF